MSLCDRCYAPGTCCRVLCLGIQDPVTGESMEYMSPEVLGKQAAFDYAESRNLPFFPLLPRAREERDGIPHVAWYFGCYELDRETGRCKAYESRPDMCRAFEPASDPLCVHYRGAEAGADPI